MTSEDRPHYWSMEHYGFPDHEPVDPGVSTPAAAAPTPQTSPRRRARTVLVTAVAGLALSATAGFVAAQASADQPAQDDGVGIVQVDDAAQVPLGGPFPGDGGRERGPRGGGR